MRYVVIGVVCALLFGCQTASSSPRRELIEWMHDLNEAKAVALQQSKPIMIDFYTEWCGWCKKFDEDTFSDKKVAAMAGDFVCVKVNGDENKALVREMRVQGYPTIAFLKSDGSVIDLFPGYQQPEQFLELLADINKKVGR